MKLGSDLSSIGMAAVVCESVINADIGFDSLSLFFLFSYFFGGGFSTVFGFDFVAFTALLNMLNLSANPLDIDFLDDDDVDDVFDTMDGLYDGLITPPNELLLFVFNLTSLLFKLLAVGMLGLYWFVLVLMLLLVIFIFVLSVFEVFLLLRWSFNMVSAFAINCLAWRNVTGYKFVRILQNAINWEGALGTVLNLSW